MLFKRTVGTLAAFLIAGATVLATSAAASPPTSVVPEPCVPAAAYDETVVDHAAWDETIPAVTTVVHHDAITHVVHHDAVYKTVHHDAVTHQEYQYVKQEQTRGGWNDVPQFLFIDWSPTVRTTIDEPGIGTYHFTQPSQHDGDTSNTINFWGGHFRVIVHVKTVVDKAAWDEQVLVKAAWDETVVDKAAWDETVVVTPEHVVHHDAVTHVVHHDAVTCPVPPQPCVATGAWYTEDVAPMIKPDGLYFEGQNKAVNWLHPTSGNIQGFTGATYTLVDVSGYQTAYRFVVNPNTTIHYASVTVEPYMNGWTAGQAGTFSITPASLAWSSKIASGPGSQSQPVPLSQFGTIWPDNTLLAQGFHLGSANPPTTHSTVAAVTGCVTASFVITKPAALSGVVKTDSTPVCVEPKDGTATVTHTETPWTQEYVWSDQQTAFVLGEKVYGDPVVTTSTVSDEGCIPTAPTYEPTVETTYTAWVDGTFKCGDTTVAQTRTKTVTTTTFHAVWGDGGYTKVADKPTVVTSTETQNRTLTAADLATLTCSTPTPTPTVTVTVTPTPTATTVAVVGKAAPAALASTGANWLSVALTAGLVLLAGTALTVLSVRHRREQ